MKSSPFTVLLMVLREMQLSRNSEMVSMKFSEDNILFLGKYTDSKTH